jgi:hypothetical protein
MKAGEVTSSMLEGMILKMEQGGGAESDDAEDLFSPDLFINKKYCF